jgi:hypothetical protein
MIRRLFSLASWAWAVAARNKTIQELVARVWPRVTTTTTSMTVTPAAAVEVAVVPSPPVDVVAVQAAAALVAPQPEAQPDPELRPLGSKESMDGSVWVPRILWALEYAKLRNLGPQSASDISRVLTEHSGLNVPSPNVARAFRDRKQSSAASYWKEVDGQKYEISGAGSEALRKQLASTEN